MKLEMKVTATGVVTDTEGNVLNTVPLETTVLVDENLNPIEEGD